MRRLPGIALIPLAWLAARAKTVLIEILGETPEVLTLQVLANPRSLTGASPSLAPFKSWIMRAWSKATGVLVQASRPALYFKTP
jgi:hypothetical protein